jgi:hypothetical protein
MALPDLVTSKKTQRDKDWPMIRRLVEADYDRYFAEPDQDRIRFWLRELRTPELLIECARRFREGAREQAAERAAISPAISADEGEVERRMAEEQSLEMERDRAYWAPLRAELERLRRERRRER